MDAGSRGLDHFHFGTANLDNIARPECEVVIWTAPIAQINRMIACNINDLDVWSLGCKGPGLERCRNSCGGCAARLVSYGFGLRYNEVRIAQRLNKRIARSLGFERRLLLWREGVHQFPFLGLGNDGSLGFMGANEQGKLGEIEWSSRGRGGEEGGEECRYKQLCSIGVHTGISSNSRMPFAIQNFPLAPLTDPAFAGYLRAHFDQQESNRSLGLQKIMPQNRSKRYRASVEQVDRKKSYNLNEAVATLKKFQPTKFDQTVTVSFRLGVDPKQSDQMVRGTCPLPHGSGKQVRVLVFAEGAAAKAAKDAGAEYVGFKELIQKVQDGFQDFDVAVATPAAMAEVRKLGKVLGPRGLMPNPKTGTVTEDTAKAVQEVKAGRVEFKLDKNGNVAVPVGKFSFAENQLVENGNAVIEAVVRARPATAKGRYLEAMTLSATMSPGVHIDPSPYLSV